MAPRLVGVWERNVALTSGLRFDWKRNLPLPPGLRPVWAFGNALPPCVPVVWKYGNALSLWLLSVWDYGNAPSSWLLSDWVMSDMQQASNLKVLNLCHRLAVSENHLLNTEGAVVWAGGTLIWANNVGFEFRGWVPEAGDGAEWVVQSGNTL
jgi:hypothetical protein